jgi:hypothetical protein
VCVLFIVFWACFVFLFSACLGCPFLADFISPAWRDFEFEEWVWWVFFFSWELTTLMIPLVEVGGQSLRDVNKSMELGSSGGANAHIVISTGINSVPTSDLKPASQFSNPLGKTCVGGGGTSGGGLNSPS